MSDLDEDKDVTIAAVGPGRPRVAGGPVDDAYADAEIHKACAGCGAPAFEYCRHTGGAFRRTPCAQRYPSRGLTHVL